MLIAYEDRRFRSHGGVDWRAFARAAWQAVRRGHVVSGGSTLTMQVARLLEPREDRTLGRQAAAGGAGRAARARASARTADPRPLPDAGALWRQSRRRAGGVARLFRQGAEAPDHRARRRCWSRCRSRRRRAGPDRSSRGRARRPRPRAGPRRRRAASSCARAEAEARRPSRSRPGRRPFPLPAPTPAEAAVRAEPATRPSHRLDPRRAAAGGAGDRRRASAPRRSARRLSVAIMAVDNATGEVRAHVGAADYGSRRAGRRIDMADAVRSPGSALKPFIYAMAFEAGLAHPGDHPGRPAVALRRSMRRRISTSSYQGEVTAREALQLSLNVPAVELLDRVGPPRFLARLRGAGAEIELPAGGVARPRRGARRPRRPARRPGALYAGLARRRRGARRWPRNADRPAGLRPGGRIAEPVAAWYVLDILAARRPRPTRPPGGIAFKTGTSYGYRDALGGRLRPARSTIGGVGRPAPTARRCRA